LRDAIVSLLVKNVLKKVERKTRLAPRKTLVISTSPGLFILPPFSVRFLKFILYRVVRGSLRHVIDVSAKLRLQLCATDEVMTQTLLRERKY
jgi:hypothetical protein